MNVFSQGVGQVGVYQSGLYARVAQKHLHNTDVNTHFEEPCGVAVSEAVRRYMLVDADIFTCHSKGRS